MSEEGVSAERNYGGTALRPSSHQPGEKNSRIPG